MACMPQAAKITSWKKDTQHPQWLHKISLGLGCVGRGWKDTGKYPPEQTLEPAANSEQKIYTLAWLHWWWAHTLAPVSHPAEEKRTTAIKISQNKQSAGRSLKQEEISQQYQLGQLLSSHPWPFVLLLCQIWWFVVPQRKMIRELTGYMAVL